LDIKITTTVFWFGSQNQADGDLSVAPQNRWEEDGSEHTSRSNDLLCLESSRARVSQIASKLAEEQQRVVHVSSSQRSREDEVEDGQIDAMGCDSSTTTLPFL
jgi:hypothetical protein